MAQAEEAIIAPSEDPLAIALRHVRKGEQHIARQLVIINEMDKKPPKGGGQDQGG